MGITTEAGSCVTASVKSNSSGFSSYVSLLKFVRTFFGNVTSSEDAISTEILNRDLECVSRRQLRIGNDGGRGQSGRKQQGDCSECAFGNSYIYTENIAFIVILADKKGARSSCMAKLNPNQRIYDVILDIHQGEYRIPNIQRGYEWDKPRIAKLLDSIMNGYPIGAIMYSSLPG